MDTRNYDERYAHSLENCDCSEDNKCGCTFPNNVSNYTCGCTPEQDCGCIAAKKETVTRVVKDSVCVCSPNGCACNVERTEVEE